jgi:Cdc6-like AAA superfamily ATPase
MLDHLLIFEGLDGTGKTTTASKLIQLSTADLPIHYIYFPKLETEQQTYDYFYELSNAFKYLKGIAIMDRSIVSTYAYGVETVDYLRFFQFVLDYDPIIIYFDKVYDKSKLPPNYPDVKKKYIKALDFIYEWFKVPIIMADAETFIKKVNSLEKVQQLFKLKRLP